MADLDDLRLEWETDEQWILRKSFIERNKDEIPMRRLICLSQVFINVEFLGCSYSKPVMEEMQQLSTGVANEYREKRKRVVETVFVKATDSEPATKVRSMQDGYRGNGREDAYGGQSQFRHEPRPSGRRVDAYSEQQRYESDKSVDESHESSNGTLHASNSVDRNQASTNSCDSAIGDPASLSTPVEGVHMVQAEAVMVVDLDDSDDSDGEAPPPRKIIVKETPIIRKEKSLCMVRAQLSIAPDEMRGVEKLNFACLRAHVRWTVEFEGRGMEQRKEAWLIVDDVLIIRMCSQLKRADLKAFLCEKGVAVLLRKEHDVRIGDNFVRSKYALFTTDDKRRPWHTPDELLFLWHEQKFQRVRDVLHGARKEWKRFPFDVLNAICNEESASLLLEQRVGAGDQPSDISLFLCGVFICREGVPAVPNTLGKERAQNAACMVAIQLLLKPYMKVYDDGVTLRLFTSQVPITSDIAVALMSRANAKPSKDVKDSEYALCEARLALVRDALSKIPPTRLASERLSMACVRAQVPLDIVTEEHCVRVYDVTVARMHEDEDDDENPQTLRENLCLLAVKHFLTCSLLVGRDPKHDSELCLRFMFDDASENAECCEPVDQFDEESPPAAVMTLEDAERLQELQQEEIKLKTIRMQLEAMSSAQNPVMRFDQACSKAKVPCDVRTYPVQGEFGCIVTASRVIVGRGRGISKKAAKSSACEDANSRLLKVYLAIGNVADGLELVSSNEPLSARLASALLRQIRHRPPEHLTEEAQEVISIDDDCEMIEQIPIASAIPVSLDVDDECMMAEAGTSRSLSEFVILRRADQEVTGLTAKGILNSSANFCRMKLEYLENDLTMRGQIRHRCSIRIADHFVAQREAETKKEAKDMAAIMAIATLQESCYTILVKAEINAAMPEINAEDVAGDLTKLGSCLPASNVGNKMLKRMGWAGGGIGKDGQGISEPITVLDVLKRQGLGLQAETGVSRQFRQGVQAILAEYLASGQQGDIVFSAEFGKEQRAFIHQACRRMKLKSVSYGVGDDRQITVQRMRTARELLDFLLLGGETAKYAVLPPIGFVLE